MKTASLVAKRGTDVVAREICNSACILVLLAAQKRYADWDMVFGFHIPVESACLTAMGRSLGRPAPA